MNSNHVWCVAACGRARGPFRNRSSVRLQTNAVAERMEAEADGDNKGGFNRAAAPDLPGFNSPALTREAE